MLTAVLRTFKRESALLRSMEQCLFSFRWVKKLCCRAPADILLRPRLARYTVTHHVLCMSKRISPHPEIAPAERTHQICDGENPPQCRTSELGWVALCHNYYVRNDNSRKRVNRRRISRERSPHDGTQRRRSSQLRGRYPEPKITSLKGGNTRRLRKPPEGRFVNDSSCAADGDILAKVCATP